MKLFTVTPTPLNLPGLNMQINYPLVKPSGSGIIDVKNNFQWKNSVTPNTVDEVPSILLTEYSIPYGKWLNNLITLLGQTTSITGAVTNASNQAKEAFQKTNDPYITLYNGVATGFKYNLPYLVKPGNSVVPNINNNWKQLSISDVPIIGGQLKKLSNTIEDVLDLTTSGFGFEPPMIYSSTNKRSLNISFPLYNTVSYEKTVENFSLVQLLSIQSLKTRTTFLTYIPPKIYTVESLGLGGIFMPAAFISGFSVESIGTTREVVIDDDVCLIPEAYKITITLKEMLENSSNIMHGAIDRSVKPVSVIQRPVDSKGKPLTQQEANQKGMDNLNNLINIGSNALKKGIDYNINIFNNNV